MLLFLIIKCLDFLYLDIYIYIYLFEFGNMLNIYVFVEYICGINCFPRCAMGFGCIPCNHIHPKIITFICIHPKYLWWLSPSNSIPPSFT